MRKYLKFWSMSLWYESMGARGIEDVKFPLFKPPATVTIDDRALTFDGTWPDLQTLREFTPWNKRKSNAQGPSNSDENARMQSEAGRLIFNKRTGVLEQGDERQRPGAGADRPE